MKTKKLLLFVALIFSEMSFAQVNITNTGSLKISSSTDTLYINGNFTNSSAASLINNGKLYVKGNLKNDQASMSAGTGTLYLNGGSAQTLSGSQIFKTYNFVSNNSSGITLNNNLSVSGTHTFTAGLITTSSTPNYLVYEAGSSYTGDNDSKHVNGWVKKYGSTDFTFPVGDATYERTAGLSNLSLASEFNCKYSRTTQNINNLQAPLVKVDSAEYWDINQVSGGTAQVVLNWDNSKVPFMNVPLSAVAVADYTGGLWTDAGGTASGNVSTIGTVTSDPKASFSPFTFGSTSYPLPLKLISFSAEKMTGYILTKWTTENEENVDHYEIQKSMDAIQFSTIGNKAARNLTYTQQYEFDDYSPLQGTAYYRLKTIDDDGKYNYSKIVAVTDKVFSGTDAFSILSPSNNAIIIFNKTTLSGDFMYRILNVNGQVLQKGTTSISANGINVLQVSFATSTGMYLLEMRKGDNVYLNKLMLQ